MSRVDANISVYFRVCNQIPVSACVDIPDNVKKILCMISGFGKVRSHSSDKVVPTHSSKLVHTLSY